MLQCILCRTDSEGERASQRRPPAIPASGNICGVAHCPADRMREREAETIIGAVVVAYK